MISRVKSGLMWAMCAVVLVGCGGGSDDGGTVQPPPQQPPPPPADPSFDVERVFGSLPLFSDPVAMLQAPSDSTRWFVVEQAGRVLAFENVSSATQTQTFLDIRPRVTSGVETGLLGMAFHPGFPNVPLVFVNYTAGGPNLVSRISVFETANGGQTLSANSERILLTVQQPEPNHNGGGIAFGPDGYLYIGLGDGGGANDQHGSIGNGQSLTTLLGKFLRIDVDGATGGVLYGIPTDNPFAGNPLCGAGGTGTQNCPELYAWGFRNPWRWSFDADGDLWVGDVGQSAMEEVDIVERGGNYGWRCFEGTRNTGNGCGAPANPLPPVAEYGRTLGTSITGGYVYRGSAITALVGRYVFGDFGSGRMWSIPADTDPTLTVTGEIESGLSISSFGEGEDRELYVVDYGGALYKLVPP